MSLIESIVAVLVIGFVVVLLVSIWVLQASHVQYAQETQKIIKDLDRFQGELLEDMNQLRIEIAVMKDRIKKGLAHVEREA